MRAGRLKHRITIQEPTTTVDTFGDPAPIWTDLVTTWAAVEPLRGREFRQADRTEGEVSHRLLIRGQAALEGLGRRHRILFGARVFDIEAVIDRDERGRELEIMAVERV